MHALETTCLLSALDELGGEDFSKEGFEGLLRSVYETKDDGEEDGGPAVSSAEAAALRDFLASEATRPPLSALVWLRSTAFRLGSRYLSDESDRGANVALLKSINVVVRDL